MTTVTVGVLFKRKLRSAIEALGWSFDAEGRLLDENGNIVRCLHCGKELRINDIGGFIPGSIEVLCKAPRCLHMLPWYYFSRKEMEGEGE